MPRVPLSSEHKVAQTNYDYPKLKLKKGEYARVLVGLEDPLYEYTHNLRKPLIVNGVPVMTTETRRDGSSFETNKMGFVGNPLCLGDAAVLDAQGSDPKNCPVCEFAKRYPDYAEAPKRRYAMHVIRYKTRSGGKEIQTPFSVEVLVWAFAPRVYNKLADLREEWKDLRLHDLILGPCESESFQNFDINVAANAAWQSSDEAKQRTIETFRDNQIPDLTIAIGSAKKREWIEQDLRAIKEAWDEVNGSRQESAASLDEGLDGLFGEPVSKAAPKAPASPASAPTEDVVDDNGEIVAGPNALPKESTDDLLASFGSIADGAPEEDEKKPTQQPAPAQPKQDAPVDNFADLLSGL